MPFARTVSGAHSRKWRPRRSTAPDPEPRHELSSVAGRLVVKDTIMMGTAVVTMADSAKAYLRKRAHPAMPVEVRFPRPLDRALLSRSLAVTDAGGQPVPGTVEVGAKERSWSFVPAKSWAEGEHTITVDDRLEDLAGNTLRRPFGLNLKAPPMREPLTLPFRVKK